MLAKYLKEYGLGMLIVTSATRVIRNVINNRNLINWFDWQKHKICMSYLWKRYADTVDYSKNPSKMHCLKAFVFWWQGEDNAPDIVRCCINSIRRNHNGEVIVLSKDNFQQYSNIPQYIIDKAVGGGISLAHFSDVLRFNLLYNHGGLWIDATCLLTHKIPEKVYENDFYSLKEAFHKSMRFEWTSFYMYASKGNMTMKNMLNYYYKYWKEHDLALTYLILDCWLMNLCRHTSFGKILNGIPAEGKNVFNVTRYMNEAYTPELWNRIDSFYVYKLSYKHNYLRLTSDGKGTVYAHLLKEYGI